MSNSAFLVLSVEGLQWEGSLTGFWGPSADRLFSECSRKQPELGYLPANRIEASYISYFLTFGRSPSYAGQAMVRRILIADDNAVIRRTLRDLFRQTSDLEVCGEAENGWDALVKAGELHPDLIVLDLSMPFINGLEAARILKRMMPAVPLILFSLYTSYLGEEEARSAGISALVSKADPPYTLINKARRLLSQPAA